MLILTIFLNFYLSHQIIYGNLSLMYKLANSTIFLLLLLFKKLVKGFEPPTYGLQNRCSTIELHQQILR